MGKREVPDIDFAAAWALAFPKPEPEPEPEPNPLARKQMSDKELKSLLPPAAQCVAHSKQTGKPCKRNAEPGTTVCRAHGSEAPQTKAAAKARLLAAVDPIMARLVEIALSPNTSDGDVIKAATWALERAGFNAKIEIDARVKPWEELIDVEGILVESPGIVEAEVVDDAAGDYEALAAEQEAAMEAEAEAETPDAEVLPLPTVIHSASSFQPREWVTATVKSPT